MKTKEISKKNKSELQKELSDHKVALRDIRFNVAGGKNKNVKAYANIKKQIARINTVMRNNE